MCDRERRDNNDERTQPPERNNQTGEEQQVVGAVENVPEALNHETHHRLMPAWIEIDKTRRAVKLEGAYRAIRWHEAQRGVDAAAEPVHTQIDGEFRAFGLDRIFEQHVEQLLAPVQIEIVGKRRPEHMSAGLLEGGKRFVRRQRYQRGDDAGLLKLGAVLVNVD